MERILERLLLWAVADSGLTLYSACMDNAEMLKYGESLGVDPKEPLKLTRTPQEPNYLRIRNAVKGMIDKAGGGILSPKGLAPIFYGYLQRIKPNGRMNKLIARNMANVFKVLLDASHIFTSEYNGNTPKEWFYVTDKIWQDNLLNKRNLKRYINLLMHMKLLGKCIGNHPLIKGSKITFYKIDPEAVENIANEMYDRHQAKRQARTQTPS
jgi:hypothetical protein